MIDRSMLNSAFFTGFSYAWRLPAAKPAFGVFFRIVSEHFNIHPQLLPDVYHSTRKKQLPIG
jgi:hypothetical protein